MPPKNKDKSPKVTGNSPSSDKRNFPEKVVDFLFGDGAGGVKLGNGEAEKSRQKLKNRKSQLDQQMRNKGI